MGYSAKESSQNVRKAVYLIRMSGEKSLQTSPVNTFIYPVSSFQKPISFKRKKKKKTKKKSKSIEIRFFNDFIVPHSYILPGSGLGTGRPK